MEKVLRHIKSKGKKGSLAWVNITTDKPAGLRTVLDRLCTRQLGMVAKKCDIMMIELGIGYEYYRGRYRYKLTISTNGRFMVSSQGSSDLTLITRETYKHLEK